MKRFLLLAAFLLMIPPVQAQVVGTCAPARAEAYLETENLRARIHNDGSLFSRGNLPVYEVPPGSGQHAMYGAALWVGGRLRDQTRTVVDTLIAASSYGPYEFWPGPLDAHGNPPADCTPYDRFWEITQEDLETYNEMGVASESLLTWPWRLGAPVVDGDGDETNYDLENGDRPALLGDQMLWWIMNDAGSVHRRTRSQPIHLEVHGTAFTFDRGTPLGNTTFYRYRFVYKGQYELTDAYVGFWADPDIGYASDDYIFYHQSLKMVYVHNAGSVDGGGVFEDAPFTYGDRAPALGVTLLPTSQVWGEPPRNFGFVCHPQLSSFASNQSGNEVAYEVLRGQRQYSRRCEYGRDGDHHFLIITGPFHWLPGDIQELAYAIVWARGEDSSQSVQLLRDHVSQIRAHTDLLLTPFAEPIAVAVEQTAPLPDLALFNFPNPFAETTTIRYSLPQPMQVRLTVYDLLGREVTALVEGQQPAGIHQADFDASNLPAGVYVARLWVDHLAFTKTMGVAR